MAKCLSSYCIFLFTPGVNPPISLYLQIEESILDKLAWEEHSPLYEALHNAGDIVPSCESVCFGPNIHGDAGLHTSTAILSSPVMQRPIFKISGDKVVGYRKYLDFLFYCLNIYLYQISHFKFLKWWPGL